MVKHEDDVEWMRFVQNAAGAILGPMDSWLVLRGTKTLDVRMERTNANAQALAEFLGGAPERERDHLPGTALASAARPGEAADARIRRADFVRHGSMDAARRLLARVRLMALAESLGGVETLISHPAVDDPRLGAAGAARRHRDHRRIGPRVGRHRSTWTTSRTDLAQALEKGIRS